MSRPEFEEAHAAFYAAMAEKRFKWAESLAMRQFEDHQFDSQEWNELRAAWRAAA